MIKPVLTTENEIVGKKAIVTTDNQLIGRIVPTGTLVASVVSLGVGAKQIYRGANLPTDPNILIWIDTSIPPITGTQLITADDKEFITSDNKAFILNEITPNALLTSDDKEFIEANNKIFILKEEL